MTEILEKIVAKAESDADFAQRLIFTPKTALRAYKLSDEQRQAVGAASPESLIGLASGILRAGCGPSGTCDQTCNKTCGKTCTETFGKFREIGLEEIG